jgi:hypothetical protein
MICVDPQSCAWLYRSRDRTHHGAQLKDVEAILDAHYLTRDARLAENAIRKLVKNEKRSKGLK